MTIIKNKQIVQDSLKRFMAIVMIATVVTFQVTPAVTYAQTTAEPTPNTAPTQSAAPTSSAEKPASSDAPTPSNGTTVSPTPTPAGNNEPSVNPTEKPKTQEQIEEEKRRKAAEDAWKAAYYGTTPTPTQAAQQNATGSTTGNASSGSDASKNVGDTKLSTGDGTNSASINTTGNNNISGASTGSNAGSSASIGNTGNGAGSNNNGSSASVSNNTTDQNNSAKVGNAMNQATITGSNSASFNNGNTTLDTGNANVSGTAITAVNTNAAGMSVSEFNVVDDQKGDLVLDDAAFAANCIQGCATGTTSATNSGNGAQSNNTADATSQINGTTFQNNDAAVGNNLVLSASSGQNDASFNTGGDTTINTGDANVAANAVTFANNNIAGTMTYGVVNIYGNLEGDIILPDFTSGPVSGTGTATNAGNGAQSNNTATLDSNAANNTFQGNNVAINNELILNGDTGNNSASYGTDGKTVVKTGESNVNAEVTNVANSNVVGDFWLVIVNQAGNWFGQIIGAPTNATVASSQGTDISTDENGQTNVSNGAQSNNATSNSTSASNNTTQTNTGVINNYIDLSAFTGGNSTDYNTGGKNTINTGDANIMANIVNFVNNNFLGNVKILQVNVLSDMWKGNIITGDHVISSGGNKETGGKDASPAKESDQEVNVEDTISDDSTELLEENETTVVTEYDTYKQDETANSTDAQAGTQYVYAGSNTTTQVNGSYVSIGKAGEVAGAKDNHSGNILTKAFLGDSDTKQKVKLNLAWLMLVLPIAASIFGIRKIARRFTR